MTRVLVAGAVLVALGAAGCGGSRTSTVTVTRTRTVTVTVTAPTSTGTTTTGASTAAACTGGELGGVFTTVAGSAGAGQISYLLTLTNASSASCFVSGVPAVQLLDKNGAALPTHGSAAQPGTQTAARVVLAPGASATSLARFSPDVPGSGEQQTGPCEPTAITLRVEATGGGTVDVPIKPVTSVCEQGSIRFSLFSSAG